MTEIFQIEARIAVNSGTIDKIRNKELEDFSQQGRVPRHIRGSQALLICPKMLEFFCFITIREIFMQTGRILTYIIIIIQSVFNANCQPK